MGGCDATTRSLTVPVLRLRWRWGRRLAQADALKMYRVTVDAEAPARSASLGVDMGHTGYKRGGPAGQTIFVDLEDGQAKSRAKGSASKRSRRART